MFKSNPLGNIEVLLVDNDERIVRLEKDILHEFGFRHIGVATDGKDAIEHMKYHNYDILISDWEMRPMTGIELTRIIRHDFHSPNPFIPIIMITGRAEREDVLTARDAGVNEFVAKPFTVDDVRRRIINVIDHPRPFIISDDFKGPDRRRHAGEPPDGIERRKGQPGYVEN